MLTDFITKVDFMILDWIQEHLRCETLDLLMPVVTFLGNKGWFFVLMAVVLLCIPKYRKRGIMLGCSYGFGFIFGNMLIKNTVQRVRPYDQVEQFELLIEKLSDYSFPSGHTLIAFELFAVMCMLPVKKVYKGLTGIFALLMAFSRVYLYVHFPSDVVASMILGTIFGVMGVRIVKMIEEEQKIKKEQNPSDI